MPGLAGHAPTQIPDDFLVFHCNWRALRVFQHCSNQWRFSPGGGIHSLDYAAVAAVMEMMNIPARKRLDTLRRVRVIESGVLEALQRQRTKNG